MLRHSPVAHRCLDSVVQITLVRVSTDLKAIVRAGVRACVSVVVTLVQDFGESLITLSNATLHTSLYRAHFYLPSRTNSVHPKTHSRSNWERKVYSTILSCLVSPFSSIYSFFNLYCCWNIRDRKRRVLVLGSQGVLPNFDVVL